VVTGVDPQGRSRVESDQPISNGASRSTDFWVVRQVPSPLTGPLEPTSEWRGGNQAPSGGAIGRLLIWPPGFSYPRHTTPSLDFIIVMSGQLELILDTESKILSAGDVVVQRGTAHSWRVPGPEPCTFAGIMLDAQARA
jgi:quercetin dioxygenase-like cupin family protein